MDQKAFEAMWRVPDGVRRGYADCRFGQLHYAVYEPANASRTPLICCHASPVTWRSWQALMPAIGRDRMVVAFDSPGHGDSSKPATQPAIQDYAAAIGDALDVLGLDRFDVIGNHTGSKVCVALALQRPRSVRRLVLISAPFYSDADLKTMKARYAEVPLAEDGSHWLTRWKALQGALGASLPVEYVHRTFVDTLRGGLEYEWGHHAAFAFQHADHLPRVAQPVLVLNPHDEIHEATKRGEQHLKNGRLVDLESSHELLDLQPDDFADVLRDFLDGPAEDPDPVSLTPEPVGAGPAARPTRVRRAYRDVGFGRMHYLDATPDREVSRPVVCLHASPRSGRDFGGIPEVLGHDRRVIAPDFPGLGGSAAPAAPMTMEQWDDSVLALLDQLGVGEFDVFGYHTGSVAAVDLALRAHDRVKNVAVISLPLMEQAAREQHLASIAPDLIVREDGSHLIELWQKKWPFRGSTQSLELFDAFMSEYVRSGPYNFWAYRALFGYPLETNLAKVSQPVLVFNPKDEISDNTRAAVPLLPDGRLIDVAPWAYGMLDTNAEDIARLVRAHFDA